MVCHHRNFAGNANTASGDVVFLPRRAGGSVEEDGVYVGDEDVSR